MMDEEVIAEGNFEHQNGAVTMTFEGDFSIRKVESAYDVPEDMVAIRVDGGGLSGQFLLEEDDFESFTE